MTDIKQMIQSAIPGWNGRLATHHIGYLGNGAVHRGVPYSATDPKVIAKKLELMQSVGIDVVITTWQGPYAAPYPSGESSCHLDATLMSAMCAQVGMQFALLLDPWCAKLSASGPSNTAYTTNIINALNYPSTQTMLNSTSYVPEKFILDFTTGADLPTLRSTFPKYDFLQQGVGFSWIAIPVISDSVQRNAAAVANLKGQNSNPSMLIPGVCSEFNDSGQPLPVGVQLQSVFDADGGNRNYSNSTWGGPARVLDSFNGLFLQQQLAVTPAASPMIAIVTWDDPEERSSGPLENYVATWQGVDWSTL